MNRLYFFLLITGMFLQTCLSAQTFRDLSPEEVTQVQRLEELIQLQLNDGQTDAAGKAYSQIAFTYWRAGRPEEAISYFIASSEAFLQGNNLKETKNVYTNIGVIYSDLEQLDYALEYFNKSLELRRKLVDKADITAGLIDVAYMLQVLGYYDDAIEKLLEAEKLATQINNTNLILECYSLLSSNYEHIGNMKKAQEFEGKAESYQTFIAEQSLKEEYTEEVIRETSEQIVKSEEEKRLAQQILALQKQLYTRTQDSLGAELALKDEVDRQRQRDIDFLKQQQELDRAKIEQGELVQKEQAAQQQKQRIMILAAMGIVLLLVLLGIIMLRANRSRKKANQKLAKQNKEIAEKSDQLSDAVKKIAHQNQNIRQSINYAKGIQSALLPKEEHLNNYIDDSFILFKPRDIVSGDFYWFKEIDSRSDIFKIFGMNRMGQDQKAEENVKKKFAVSAVDCTGHGVPGAFMSMIGYNLLDEITGKGITRPDLILEELHRGVRTALKQKETNNQDGMDMALCLIDEENKKVEFSGAKNPLIYVQNGEVTQIKGDKYGIGGKIDEHKFTLHTINVDSPTWFYLFSDGYIDQFGGETGRKFMIKRFREMLHENHGKDLQEQKDILDVTLKDWKGESYNQIDDILVIGFKLDFSQKKSN